MDNAIPTEGLTLLRDQKDKLSPFAIGVGLPCAPDQMQAASALDASFRCITI